MDDENQGDTGIRELKQQIKQLEREVAMLTKAVEGLRDGMSSTTLTAALIERLVERLDG